MKWLVLLLALFWNCLYYSNGDNARLPFIINTWPFEVATKAAWEVVRNESSSALDAVVAGCSACERHQCDGTVGYGGSPDENGETTLDAMVMDGVTHDVGAVAGLRSIKDAAAVARAVLKYTKHTLLAGELATDFAVDMGFTRTDLQTNVSREIWKSWRREHCQPNYWQSDVSPNPKKACGPYKPHGTQLNRERYNRNVNQDNHDTVGMLVIDHHGNMAVGTSTNGASHKIPGRVGDSPIMGAGAYVDNSIGGAAATGDGDVMMRFLPSYHAVSLMEARLTPTQACRVALSKIIKYYPKFSGALIAATVSGEYGAACHGFQAFPYCVQSAATGGQVKVFNVTCT